MKKVFGDNAANIAGHRVPYSLLAALAAILGAFLIWKSQTGGGVSVPSLSDFGGGGGVGGSSGSTNDLGASDKTPTTTKAFPVGKLFPVGGNPPLGAKAKHAPSFGHLTRRPGPFEMAVSW